MAPNRQINDRRIQKTRKVLHEALGSLILEKPYDKIAVKEILDRANVGRSTFYTHFRDKDELLASAVHEMLRATYTVEAAAPGEPQERIVRFSLPVFEHVGRHRHMAAPGMGSRGRAIVHEHLKQVLAELIAKDVGGDLHGRRRTTNGVPQGLLVQYLASTFVLVLNWWTESKSSLRAREVDDLFRALVLPTLATIRK